MKSDWKNEPLVVLDACALIAFFKAFSRISLADAVALGLASTRQAPLATSDHHEFEPIEAAGSSRFLWIR